MTARPPTRSPKRAATSATKRVVPSGQAIAGNKGHGTKAKAAVQTRQRIRPETRAEMLERLTNPQITLHEASVILRKCPATVRSYCDAGYLPHERTSGGQRRFFLRDVLAFLRAREAEKRR